MNIKFLHIKSHLIHICLLTEFEIFFYIYYILPYEKSIFKKLLDTNNYINYNDFNITFTNQLDAQNKECYNYQENMDNDNQKLFRYCYIYIGVINICTIIYFLYDLFKTFNLYCVPNSPKYNSRSSLVLFNNFNNDKKNDNNNNNNNNNNEFELVDIENPTINQNQNKDNLKKNDNKVPFYIFYWHTSGFLYEFGKTTQFIILIGIFEYLFFNYIVNKIKIANSKTVLCNIIKNL
jgi:hypothetical protein